MSAETTAVGPKISISPQTARPRTNSLTDSKTKEVVQKTAQPPLKRAQTETSHNIVQTRLKALEKSQRPSSLQTLPLKVGSTFSSAIDVAKNKSGDVSNVEMRKRSSSESSPTSAKKKEEEAKEKRKARAFEVSPLPTDEIYQKSHTDEGDKKIPQPLKTAEKKVSTSLEQLPGLKPEVNEEKKSGSSFWTIFGKKPPSPSKTPSLVDSIVYSTKAISTLNWTVDVLAHLQKTMPAKFEQNINVNSLGEIPSILKNLKNSIEAHVKLFFTEDVFQLTQFVKRIKEAYSVLKDNKEYEYLQSFTFIKDSKTFFEKYEKLSKAQKADIEKIIGGKPVFEYIRSYFKHSSLNINALIDNTSLILEREMVLKQLNRRYPISIEMLQKNAYQIAYSESEQFFYSFRSHYGSFDKTTDNNSQQTIKGGSIKINGKFFEFGTLKTQHQNEIRLFVVESLITALQNELNIKSEKTPRQQALWLEGHRGWLSLDQEIAIEKDVEELFRNKSGKKEGELTKEQTLRLKRLEKITQEKNELIKFLKETLLSDNCRHSKNFKTHSEGSIVSNYLINETNSTKKELWVWMWDNRDRILKLIANKTFEEELDTIVQEFYKYKVFTNSSFVIPTLSLLKAFSVCGLSPMENYLKKMFFPGMREFTSSDDLLLRSAKDAVASYEITTTPQGNFTVTHIKPYQLSKGNEDRIITFDVHWTLIGELKSKDYNATIECRNFLKNASKEPFLSLGYIYRATSPASDKHKSNSYNRSGISSAPGAAASTRKSRSFNK